VPWVTPRFVRRWREWRNFWPAACNLHANDYRNGRFRFAYDDHHAERTIASHHDADKHARLLAQNKVARITASVAAFYGALLATTPMLATVSSFFIEGTAQTYRTTPLDGARASHTVLPNRSVT
jgi:hypothetical protein